MAWGQVVAIELTDCPTDYGLWFSFLFMHQTHVPLSVAMSVNLVTIICRVGDVTTLCQMKHCASRGLCKLFFFFITCHGCAFAVASSHDWLCVWVCDCMHVCWSAFGYLSLVVRFVCVCDLTIC